MADGKSFALSSKLSMHSGILDATISERHTCVLGFVELRKVQTLATQWLKCIID